LGAIITKDHTMTEQNKSMKVIGNYFDINIIKKYHTDHDALAVFNGAIKKSSPPQLKKLYNVVIRLILDNPWLFIKNRIVMMRHMFLATNKTLTLNSDLDGIPTTPPDFETKIANTTGLLVVKKTGEELSPFKYIGQKLLRLYRTHPFVRVFFTFIPSLFLFIVSIFFFRRAPLTAMIGLICFIRVPIFIMFAPAAQMKYLFDVYLYGLIFIPVFYWEFRYGETFFLFIRANKIARVILRNTLFIFRKAKS
jgi:hypothetical protein